MTDEQEPMKPTIRDLFPGHIRPTPEEFESLWGSATVAIDANVLLNLYRYSDPTRHELELALRGNAERLFLPNRAGLEYLRNRTTVTAEQAEQYTRAIKGIGDLGDQLLNRKRHPFLRDISDQAYVEFMQRLRSDLESQREAVLNRTREDEVLDFVQELFDGRTGTALEPEVMTQVLAEGEKRFAERVPPGYMDRGKDEGGGDPERKFGDLILWKELIAEAKNSERPMILVTDDKKEDWWLEKAGRRMGPRPELVEEFRRESEQQFWMYSVDRFMEESARRSKTEIDPRVIREIIELREEIQAAMQVGPESEDLGEYLSTGDGAQVYMGPSKQLDYADRVAFAVGPTKVAAGEQIGIAVFGYGLSEVKNVDITVRLLPIEVFDQRSVSFEGPEGMVSLGPQPASEDSFRVGSARIGGDGLRGDMRLGMVTVRTLTSVAEPTDAIVRITRVSVGPSSTKRSEFEGEDIGLGVAVVIGAD